MTNSMPVSLITGAGTGIGRAIARRLSADGHALVLVGRRPGPLRETAAMLDGPSLEHPADVSDPDQAEPVVRSAVDRFGRLDNLVNNAGIAPVYPIHETTPQHLDEVFAINALATGNLIAAAWPVFVAQRAGCVVNLSSMATLDPFPGFFAYAASKAAVELMVVSCAQEGAEHGIRAFAVAPGAVETEMLRKVASPEELPSERCLKPDAVADVIAQCIRGERDDMNGKTIRLPSP